MALPRIASLQPSISLVLRDLDRLDTLVACTRYCVEAIPELASMPVTVIADTWTAKAGEILAAQPDLVIASVPYRAETFTEILKARCPILALAPRTLADINHDIRLISSLVYASNKGQSLITTMAFQMEAVRARAAQAAERPLVYCEEWGKPLIHSQEWVQELVTAAGGRCLGPPGSRTDAGRIMAADPDVMIFAWCGAGDRVPLGRVIQQRDWHKLRAVREGRVFCVPDEWLNTPAPTVLRGLHAIAGAIHPELFSLPPEVRCFQ